MTEISIFALGLSSAVVGAFFLGRLVQMWSDARGRAVLRQPDVLLVKLGEIEHLIGRAQLEHDPLVGSLNSAHRIVGECQRMLEHRPSRSIDQIVESVLGPTENGSRAYLEPGQICPGCGEVGQQGAYTHAIDCPIALGEAETVSDEYVQRVLEQAGHDFDSEHPLIPLLNAEVYLNGPWPVIYYDPPGPTDEALRALDARQILKRFRAARALGLTVTSIDWLNQHPESMRDAVVREVDER